MSKRKAEVFPDMCPIARLKNICKPFDGTLVELEGPSISGYFISVRICDMSKLASALKAYGLSNPYVFGTGSVLPDELEPLTLAARVHIKVFLDTR